MLLRLWTVAESIESLSASALAWREHLGDAFDRALGSLRLVGRADRLPCPMPGGSACARRVVDDEEGPIAVCGNQPSACDSISLRRGDDLLYELPISEIAAAAATALRLAACLDLAPEGEISRLGAVTDHEQLPAFLGVAISGVEPIFAARRLLEEIDGSIVLVLPRRLLGRTRDLAPLKKRKCRLVALEDALEAYERGVELSLPAVSPTRPAAPRFDGELSKDRGRWSVRFRSRSATVPHVLGLDYLVPLLGSPRTAFAAADLMRAGAGKVQPRLGDAGELLDERARASYKSRIAVLCDRIDDARELGNERLVGELETERDWLVHELASATGLGGRRRRASNDAERVRKAVAMAIGRAIAGFERDLPDLATHLRSAVRLGYSVSYEPDAETQWKV